MNPGIKVKFFSKSLHWEQGWEEPLIKEIVTMGLLLCIQYFDDKLNSLFQRNTGTL